jgi:hypothetical protein
MRHTRGIPDNQTTKQQPPTNPTHQGEPAMLTDEQQRENFSYSLKIKQRIKLAKTALFEYAYACGGDIILIGKHGMVCRKINKLLNNAIDACSDIDGLIPPSMIDHYSTTDKEPTP